MTMTSRWTQAYARRMVQNSTFCKRTSRLSSMAMFWATISSTTTFGCQTRLSDNLPSHEILMSRTVAVSAFRRRNESHSLCRLLSRRTVESSHRCACKVQRCIASQSQTCLVVKTKTESWTTSKSQTSKAKRWCCWRHRFSTSSPRWTSRVPPTLIIMGGRRLRQVQQTGDQKFNGHVWPLKSVNPSSCLQKSS